MLCYCVSFAARIWPADLSALQHNHSVVTFLLQGEAQHAMQLPAPEADEHDSSHPGLSDDDVDAVASGAECILPCLQLRELAVSCFRL